MLTKEYYSLDANMINFDAVDFSECPSEYIINFFWHSVYHFWYCNIQNQSKNSRGGVEWFKSVWANFCRNFMIWTQHIVETFDEILHVIIITEHIWLMNNNAHVCYPLLRCTSRHPVHWLFTIQFALFLVEFCLTCSSVIHRVTI